MALTPKSINQYHIFLASPGDVTDERQIVRDFFDRYNRTAAKLFNVHFEVIDWENYSTIGVGRPQELITQQTLERFKSSLVLIIGIMGQRFGSPTGKEESGTQEEFQWALDHYRENGFPEIKWFFKKIDKFVAPPIATAISEALAQWELVTRFRTELRAIPMYVADYGESVFKETFEEDLGRWLSSNERPWSKALTQEPSTSIVSADEDYYQTIKQEFQRLDIAGIDNDRAFEIPLSEIYVRLRVIFDEESSTHDHIGDTQTIDIQTALLRYPKLAIVGDPGSGKSTFLKYVALMLARSVLERNSAIAVEKLYIQEPLPIPVFVSCWDLSDFLKRHEDVDVANVLDFLTDRLNKFHFQIDVEKLKALLKAGNCAVLFDGLDEVPTDSGRAVISRLLEEFVRKFPENRYVVTSRIRAYTGDTILKGDFARCDIQPFDRSDREEFIKNWAALLFKILPESVLLKGTEANREFQSLIDGIESNDRIRALAINPLLLTVIAIVHWNRKRLPEQRVDLYDECVDVLLGQRKEAEQVQARRTGSVFKPDMERLHKEERPWIRKRFAEIALKILQGTDKRDEASKSDILKLLAPRFVDRGARTLEDGEIKAAHFLDQQELRSGLLVSRREQSYRFVHLTFQEYLAAWNLSNQDFDKVVTTIQPHLREQRWFEPLQLLGGEWAKHSDEKLDRYLRWLLDEKGTTITERAPVVALCANIVNDSVGTAEMTPDTRDRFEQAVESTLDAFRPKSGVPVLTQLEILEALGKLGASVKSHLIDATKSGLNQVRGRAIEMLLPHLSDDELFAMRHILEDRSKVPITAFLSALLGRDKARIVMWLEQQKQFSEKATDAFTEMLWKFGEELTLTDLNKVIRIVFERGRSYYGGEWASRSRLLRTLNDESLFFDSVNDEEAAVRASSLKHLVAHNSHDSGIQQLVRDRAVNDIDEYVRRVCVGLVARGGSDPERWPLVIGVLKNDTNSHVRAHALRLLASGQSAEPQTWEILKQVVESDVEYHVRLTALNLIAEQYGELIGTWKFIEDRVKAGEHFAERMRAVDLLKDKQADKSHTWEIISESAEGDSDDSVRTNSFIALLEHPAIEESATGLFLSWSPWYFDFDPHGMITQERVSEYAGILKIDSDQVRARYEILAANLYQVFRFELRLEWQS